MTKLAKHLEEKLENILANDRFQGCYLLTGNDSEAKLYIAKEMAKSINCQNKSEYKACNECSVCKMIDEGRYYGFVVLNEEDKNSVKIEETRNLKRDVAANINNVIYFYKKAHLLTDQAANSLLKVLEEPPEGVMFILDSPTEYLLLPTIRSRAQIMHVGYTTIVEYQELLGGKKVDEFLDFVAETDEMDFINLSESSKLERVQLKTGLAQLVNWLFLQYREKGNMIYLELIKTVNRFIRYMERPVNINNNLLLLMLELKEKVKYV